MPKLNKHAVTAIATFSVALGIGFAMQYGDAVASRLGVDTPVAGPSSQDYDGALEVIPVAANAAMPRLQDAPSISMPKFERVSFETAPAEIDAPRFDLEGLNAETASVDVAEAAPDPAPLPAVEEMPESPLLADASEAMATEGLPPVGLPVIATDAAVVSPACDTQMSATPGGLAMVTLDLVNPCRPNATVAIHHQGMMFHAVTDDDGRMMAGVPALAEEAFFIAAFDDGEGAVAVTGVPDLALFDRAVLQWQGEDGVELHALEFGAAYGEAGHVWAGTQGDPALAAEGSAGFLTRLGQGNGAAPLMAEIYTFPSGSARQDGEILLSVEAEVTGRNCGRDVQAQSIQVIGGAEPVAVDLTMVMPDCEAVGDYVVLQNMFEDLKLAAK